MLFSLAEKKRIKYIAERVSLSLLLLIIIFVLCLAILFAVADMIFEDKNLLFDEKVFAGIKPYINQVNTRIFDVITFFGSFAFLLPGNLLLAGYFLKLKNDKHHAWKVAVVASTNVLVLFLLKYLLKRHRPPAPLITKLHDYSFPSGHTFGSVVFYGMLIFFIYQDGRNKALKWGLIFLLTLLVLAIGFSRVYLRLHYASDVIAGFCLGIIWLVLAKWILLKTERLPLETLQG